jgi:hypothetical protein
MDCDRPPPTPIASPTGLSPADRWRQPPEPPMEAEVWGSQYLAMVRDLAVQPAWVSLAHVADPPGAALDWLGRHIHQVNRQLDAMVRDLLDCFAPGEQPRVQIFAAPIAPAAGVDGFCNPHSAPITLIVDPGRIVPEHWSRLVAHELAHAVTQAGGHDEGFRDAIAHLCLAQDLPLPTPELSAETLCYWPPCRRPPDPANFWLGHP